MNNSMKINAVLKLVVLNYYNIEWKINTNNIIKEPLTPDIFEMYAYPRLAETTVDDEEYLIEEDDINPKSNNGAKNNENIIFQADIEDDDQIINDESFIKDLQADIEKKAKKEFKEFNKNNPDTKLNSDRLTIKEKISDIDFSPKDIKDNNSQSNHDIKPKFVIKLDENEKGKYYTNVLDTVDKIMSENDTESKTPKTISEIVDEILEEEEKAFNHNTNKKN